MNILLFQINRWFLFIIGAWFLSGCSGHTYKKPPTPPPPSHVYYRPIKTEVRSSKIIHRATLRPYTVHGRTYYPTVVSVGWRQEGIASWYGPNFHGGTTSNGERYNMYAMTAAHKTLPMNTMIRVTNKRNGKSVVVRVNDRGPFVRGRIVDLSYVAGKKIGIDRTGTAPVVLEVIGFDSLIASIASQKGQKGSKRVILGEFGVQVGAFRRMRGAKVYKERYDHFEGRYRTTIKKYVVDGKLLYRVLLTGFKSAEEAEDFIKTWKIPGAFIIRL